MKPMSLLALPFLLVTGGCLFVGPADPPPPPDDCRSPGALDGIESIELGAMQSNTFVPWQEDEVVELTYGSQGGAMLGVVLALRGDNLPTCMWHTMELRWQYSGGFLAGTEYPVRTYPMPDGTRSTATIWMIFEGEYPGLDDEIELVLHVDRFEIRRSLLVGS